MESVSVTCFFKVVCRSCPAFPKAEGFADHQPFDMQSVDKDFFDEVLGAQAGDRLVETGDDDFVEMALR